MNPAPANDTTQPPLRVVAPHIHLWDLSTHRYPWMESSAEGFLGDTASLKKTYLLGNLLADAGSDIAIEQCVHVEANHDPSDPLEETRWLQSLADAPGANGLPGGIVAAADLSLPNVQAVIEAHGQFRNLRGIRQILNVHAQPRFDYVGRHYMAESLWCRNFQLLARFGLSFDLQIYPGQMAQAAQLARSNPDTVLVLNHAGMFVDRSSPEGWRTWRAGLQVLAGCPNVMVKISGLAMFDHKWTRESLRPYVLTVIDTFGAERAMFASNFPVDRLFGAYPALWRAYDSIVADASGGERDALFRTTAQRVYRLNQSPR
jgi:predicted TIM-barrel fold metal-dependent hydrolase